MAEFYSARGWEIPPLPWTNLSPPFSHGTSRCRREGRPLHRLLSPCAGLRTTWKQNGAYVVPEQNRVLCYKRKGTYMRECPTLFAVVCVHAQILVDELVCVLRHIRQNVPRPLAAIGQCVVSSLVSQGYVRIDTPRQSWEKHERRALLEGTRRHALALCGRGQVGVVTVYRSGDSGHTECVPSPPQGC